MPPEFAPFSGFKSGFTILCLLVDGAYPVPDGPLHQRIVFVIPLPEDLACHCQFGLEERDVCYSTIGGYVGV